MERITVRRNAQDRTKFDVCRNDVPMTGFEGIPFEDAKRQAQVEMAVQANKKGRQLLPKDMLPVLASDNPNMDPPEYIDQFVLKNQWESILMGADEIPYFSTVHSQPHADSELKHVLLVPVERFDGRDAVIAWAQKTWPGMTGQGPQLGEYGFEAWSGDAVVKTSVGTQRWKDGVDRELWQVTFRSIFTD